MQALHAMFGSVTLAVVGLFSVGAAGAAWLDRGHLVVRRAVLFVGAVLGIQVVVGGVVFLGGGRPAESLHLLYGLAIVAVLPLASSFAAEAPPRPYSTVLAVAGIIQLLLAWRLLSTG